MALLRLINTLLLTPSVTPRLIIHHPEYLPNLETLGTENGRVAGVLHQTSPPPI